ncbi:MAG: lipid-A-disaccharide synthase-related protein [Armatimonadota bacterium]
MLVVSNGVGEDLIATRIVESLPREEIALTAYPLVGLGAYPSHIPLLDPRRALPGGGFSLRAGLRGLGADLAGGLVGLWIAQRRTLLGQRGRFDVVVAVGDTYCLWMAGLASPRVAFVSTADSVRIAPFGALARVGLRRYARRIFARDPETARALVAQGLPAVAVGNVMMDLMRPSGERFALPPGAPVVTLLPGSHGDAPVNASLLARAARAIAGEYPDVRFLLARAPTVSGDAIAHALRATDGAVAHAGDVVAIGPARIHLTSAFADALERASVVIGLAGTANEQAVGVGRPVVAFPAPGPQFGPAFLHAQHRLLGEALVPTPSWQEAALAVVRLLRSPEERERRGAVGRARMGAPGGAQRIADALVEMIQKA